MTGIYVSAMPEYSDAMVAAESSTRSGIADTPPRPERWIPSSLRMVLLLVALIGFASAVRVGMLFHQQSRRERAKLELEASGVYVSRGVTHLVQWFDSLLPDGLASLFYKEEWEIHFELDHEPSDQGRTDAKMASLEGLTCIRCLRLGSTYVTDAGIAHLSKSTALRFLYLDGTHVTDAALSRLSGQPNLELLSLWSTNITDRGIADLQSLHNLKELYLYETKVTEASVSKLKESLPGTKIHTDWKVYE